MSSFTLPSFRLLSLSLIACLVLAGCDRQSEGQRQESASDLPFADGETFKTESGLTGRLDISQRGAAAPETVFQAPDGSDVQLSDFRGQPLLVNIWATWCAPCVKEMPMLDALAKREAERLTVIAVSQDLQGAEKVDPFFEAANFSMLEPYLDPETGLSLAIGSGLMPTTILYDSQGREVWRMIGAMDWDGARAAALLAGTLEEG